MPGTISHVATTPIEASVTIGSQHFQFDPPPEYSPFNLSPRAQEGRDALHNFSSGNALHACGQLTLPVLSAEERGRIAEGQNPGAIVFGCMDSRVTPEVVLGALNPGTMFVIRTAGQLSGQDSICSLDVGLSKAAPGLALFLGHTRCGAVEIALERSILQPDSLCPIGHRLSAVVDAFKDSIVIDELMHRVRIQSADDSTLRTLLSNGLEDPHTKEACERLLNDASYRRFSYKILNYDALWEAAVWANAHGCLNEVMERSSVFRNAYLKGEISVAVGVYNLESRQARFLGVPTVELPYLQDACRSSKASTDLNVSPTPEGLGTIDWLRALVMGKGYQEPPRHLPNIWQRHDVPIQP